MHGCANGHWVMGTYHGNANLPSTVAFGVFNASLYAESAAPKIRLDLRVTTPAECVTVVRKMFPDANAAELSNTGEVWCDAVFKVTGVIYKPLKQVCIFDDSWRNCSISERLTASLPVLFPSASISSILARWISE